MIGELVDASLFKSLIVDSGCFPFIVFVDLLIGLTSLFPIHWMLVVIG